MPSMPTMSTFRSAAAAKDVATESVIAVQDVIAVLKRDSDRYERWHPE
jgi:hypothetical protein